MTILDEILAWKRQEVAMRKEQMPLSLLEKKIGQQSPPIPVLKSFQREDSFSVIAEIKRASPSRGVLAAEVSPSERALQYQEGGAAAISVLTDSRYFHGSHAHLQAVREVCSLPLLCKDFIVDSYQIFEARAHGADMVLLIGAALERNRLRKLIGTVKELGMTPLVEIHSARELDRLPELDGCLLGVNNRDLKTFHVNIEHAIRLFPMLPRSVPVISESGVDSVEDCIRLKQAGFRGALIGEVLMTCDNPAHLIQRFMKGTQHVSKS